MSKRLAENILIATREAVKAARINHNDGLSAALDKRDMLIAQLFGIDPIGSLPDFNPANISEKAIQAGIKYKDTFNQIRSEERTLFTILNHQNKNYRSRQGLLRDSYRYINSTRDSLYISYGKRYDKEA